MWSAGRDRVVTRGRGICLPSVLLPPSAPTSYHKKVTSVAKEQRGLRGFSFRESASPEAQFPGTPLLGSSVNRGNLPTPWGRGSSPARRGGLRDHPGQQLGMREHRVVVGR